MRTILLPKTLKNKKCIFFNNYQMLDDFNGDTCRTLLNEKFQERVVSWQHQNIIKTRLTH